MYEMESLHHLLLPVRKLSQEIDRKLPDLKQKAGQGPPDQKRVNAGLKKIRELTKEVDDMTVEYKNESARVEKNSKTFSEIVKCAENSLDFSEALVSLLEAKFALKGYNPPKPLTERLKSDLREEKPFTPIINNQLIKDAVRPADDLTYCFKEGVKEQVAIPENLPVESPLKHKATLFDMPKSPQTPVLAAVARKLNVCHSPVLPDFLKADTGANIPVSKEISLLPSSPYFDSVMSPDFKELENVKKQKATTAFFPELPSSPVTPALSVPTIPWAKPSKLVTAPTKADKIVEEEDDDIVMHSRKSFFMGEMINSPEEATVNLLKSKQMVSPQSPDIGKRAGCQISECSKEPNLAHTNVEPKDFSPSFNSPQTPDLSVLQQRKYLPSPNISRERYDSLTESVKRLISYQQISTALKDIYELALTKPSHKFSAAEIERATGLAGRTKCCVLVLKTLGLVRTVAGTDMYEISN